MITFVHEYIKNEGEFYDKKITLFVLSLMIIEIGDLKAGLDLFLEPGQSKTISSVRFRKEQFNGTIKPCPYHNYTTTNWEVGIQYLISHTDPTPLTVALARKIEDYIYDVTITAKSDTRPATFWKQCHLVGNDGTPLDTENFPNTISIINSSVFTLKPGGSTVRRNLYLNPNHMEEGIVPHPMGYDFSSGYSVMLRQLL